MSDLTFMQRSPGYIPPSKCKSDKWALQCALARYRLLEEEADRQLEKLQTIIESNKQVLDGCEDVYHGLTDIAATLATREDCNLRLVVQKRFNQLTEELEVFRHHLHSFRQNRRNAELDLQFADFPIACLKAN